MGHVNVNLQDRAQILKILKDGKFHTFDEISKKTKLNIKEVMMVTGHQPYDIIGTHKGYKHIKAATKDEVMEACRYLGSKRYAMLKRQQAFKVHKGL